jgi:hypothetical protein
LANSARKTACRGNLFGWLENERIAAGDRGGKHPQGHHRRKVEGRDTGDDAKRLANLIDIDATAGLLSVAAFEQVRNAAGELNVFKAARNFAESVGDGLSVLEADDFGQAARFCTIQSRAAGT